MQSAGMSLRAKVTVCLNKPHFGEGENREGSIVVIPKGQYANDRFAYDGWTVI